MCFDFLLCDLEYDVISHDLPGLELYGLDLRMFRSDRSLAIFEWVRELCLLHSLGYGR